MPGHPPEALTLAMLAEAAQSSLPADSTVLGTDPASRALNATFLTAELAGIDGLAKVTLLALAERAEALGATAVPAPTPAPEVPLPPAPDEG